MCSESSSNPSEFLEAMQEAADILLGEVSPARAWHPPSFVDVRNPGATGKKAIISLDHTCKLETDF